jgi:catechol 2,3-dioxygenase-like lactoylglutathione lyase family enzyme
MALTAMQHVLVLTDDIDATRDFYVDVLELRPGPRPDLA